MATDRDYYAILQVSRLADQETIDRAYKRLSGIYDPATSKKPRAAARMKDIEEAYGVLGEKQGRAAYDRELGRRRGVAASAGLSTGMLMNRYLWILAGGLISGVAIIVALLIVLGGSGSSDVVANPTVSVGVKTTSPTPVGQTPGPTAPASPPDVSGAPVTTASGLQYVDTQPGTGATPANGDPVVVNYTGWLQSDGTKFDSSLDRDAPYSFILGAGNVIKGWDEGLATMQVGGKRRLIIPPDLAYGAAGRSGIPPNATLLFDVELVAIGSVGTPIPSAAPTPSP